jgi:hypothetical protein
VFSAKTALQFSRSLSSDSQTTTLDGSFHQFGELLRPLASFQTIDGSNFHVVPTGPLRLRFLEKARSCARSLR